jgi:hypothetical protein
VISFKSLTGKSTEEPEAGAETEGEVMSAHSKSVTAVANELGYFPTPVQAKEISLVAVERYGQMQTDGIAPKSGPVPDNLFRECESWAIRKVMDRILAETITGTPGDELTSKLNAILARAVGKSLRIRIEEL